MDLFGQAEIGALSTHDLSITPGHKGQIMRYRRSHLGSYAAWGILLTTLFPVGHIASHLPHVSAAVGLYAVFVLIDLGILRYLTGVTPSGTAARIHFPRGITLRHRPKVSVHQTPLGVSRLAWMRLQGRLSDKSARKAALQAIADDTVVAIVHALSCPFSGVVASSHLLNKPVHCKTFCAAVRAKVPTLFVRVSREKIPPFHRLMLSFASGVPLKKFPKTKYRLCFQKK